MVVLCMFLKADCLEISPEVLYSIYVLSWASHLLPSRVQQLCKRWIIFPSVRSVHPLTPPLLHSLLFHQPGHDCTFFSFQSVTSHRLFCCIGGPTVTTNVVTPYRSLPCTPPCTLQYYYTPSIYLFYEIIESYVLCDTLQSFPLRLSLDFTATRLLGTRPNIDRSSSSLTRTHTHTHTYKECTSPSSGLWPGDAAVPPSLLLPAPPEPARLPLTPRRVVPQAMLCALPPR